MLFEGLKRQYSCYLLQELICLAQIPFTGSFRRLFTAGIKNAKVLPHPGLDNPDQLVSTFSNPALFKPGFFFKEGDTPLGGYYTLSTPTTPERGILGGCKGTPPPGGKGTRGRKWTFPWDICLDQPQLRPKTEPTRGQPTFHRHPITRHPLHPRAVK